LNENFKSKHFKKLQKKNEKTKLKKKKGKLGKEKNKMNTEKNRRDQVGTNGPAHSRAGVCGARSVPTWLAYRNRRSSPNASAYARKSNSSDVVKSDRHPVKINLLVLVKLSYVPQLRYLIHTSSTRPLLCLWIGLCSCLLKPWQANGVEIDKIDL
jgi:hypothetical protein